MAKKKLNKVEELKQSLQIAKESNVSAEKIAEINAAIEAAIKRSEAAKAGAAKRAIEVASRLTGTLADQYARNPYVHGVVDSAIENAAAAHRCERNIDVLIGHINAAAEKAEARNAKRAERRAKVSASERHICDHDYDGEARNLAIDELAANAAALRKEIISGDADPAAIDKYNKISNKLERMLAAGAKTDKHAKDILNQRRKRDKKLAAARAINVQHEIDVIDDISARILDGEFDDIKKYAIAYGIGVGECKYEFGDVKFTLYAYGKVGNEWVGMSDIPADINEFNITYDVKYVKRHDIGVEVVAKRFTTAEMPASGTVYIDGEKMVIQFSEKYSHACTKGKGVSLSRAKEIVDDRLNDVRIIVAVGNRKKIVSDSSFAKMQEDIMAWLTVGRHVATVNELPSVAKSGDVVVVDNPTPTVTKYKAVVVDGTLPVSGVKPWAQEALEEAIENGASKKIVSALRKEAEREKKNKSRVMPSGYQIGAARNAGYRKVVIQRGTNAVIFDPAKNLARLSNCSEREFRGLTSELSAESLREFLGIEAYATNELAEKIFRGKTEEEIASHHNWRQAAFGGDGYFRKRLHSNDDMSKTLVVDVVLVKGAVIRVPIISKTYGAYIRKGTEWVPCEDPRSSMNTMVNIKGLCALREIATIAALSMWAHVADPNKDAAKYQDSGNVSGYHYDSKGHKVLEISSDKSYSGGSKAANNASALVRLDAAKLYENYESLCKLMVEYSEMDKSDTKLVRAKEREIRNAQKLIDEFALASSDDRLIDSSFDTVHAAILALLEEAMANLGDNSFATTKRRVETWGNRATMTREAADKLYGGEISKIENEISRVENIVSASDDAYAHVSQFYKRYVSDLKRELERVVKKYDKATGHKIENVSGITKASRAARKTMDQTKASGDVSIENSREDDEGNVIEEMITPSNIWGRNFTTSNMSCLEDIIEYEREFILGGDESDDVFNVYRVLGIAEDDTDDIQKINNMIEWLCKTGVLTNEQFESLSKAYAAMLEERVLSRAGVAKAIGKDASNWREMCKRISTRMLSSGCLDYIIAKMMCRGEIGSEIFDFHSNDKEGREAAADSKKRIEAMLKRMGVAMPRAFKSENRMRKENSTHGDNFWRFLYHLGYDVVERSVESGNGKSSRVYIPKPTVDGITVARYINGLHVDMPVGYSINREEYTDNHGKKRTRIVRNVVTDSVHVTKEMFDAIRAKYLFASETVYKEGLRYGDDGHAFVSQNCDNIVRLQPDPRTLCRMESDRLRMEFIHKFSEVARRLVKPVPDKKDKEAKFYIPASEDDRKWFKKHLDTNLVGKENVGILNKQIKKLIEVSETAYHQFYTGGINDPIFFNDMHTENEVKDKKNTGAKCRDIVRGAYSTSNTFSPVAVLPKNTAQVFNGHDMKTVSIPFARTDAKTGDSDISSEEILARFNYAITHFGDAKKSVFVGGRKSVAIKSTPTDFSSKAWYLGKESWPSSPYREYEYTMEHSTATDMVDGDTIRFSSAINDSVVVKVPRDVSKCGVAYEAEQIELLRKCGMDNIRAYDKDGNAVGVVSRLYLDEVMLRNAFFSRLREAYAAEEAAETPVSEQVAAHADEVAETVKTSAKKTSTKKTSTKKPSAKKTSDKK